MERHLVTGATGLVGGALVFELIAQTDAEIFCLVRGSRDEPDPVKRFAASITKAAEIYDRLELLPEVLARCQVLAGDITEPQCGVDSEHIPLLSQVWHAAASLAFEDENEEEILRLNVGGTEAVIELARRGGALALNHVSTAYVAGNSLGHIFETLPPPDSETNNAYERSKIRGEQVALASGFERVRILRPSIVIGHSRTYAAMTFTGLYGFIRNFRDVRDEVSKELGMFLDHRPLRLLAEPEVPMNFIPVDIVARCAVAIGMSDSQDTYFHLANAAPIVLKAAIDCIAEHVGVRSPHYISGREEMTSIDREVDDKLGFYSSYVRAAKTFDLSNVEAVLGVDATRDELTPERFDAFVGWYIEHLRARQRSKQMHELA
jgi:nucleoside-diphosphate-sugar epimerase